VLTTVSTTVLSLGYIVTEPPIYERLDPTEYQPLLEANRKALAALDPPIRQPLSILKVLSSTRRPYTLPSGDVLHPPPISTTKQPRKLAILGDCSGSENTAFKGLAKDASLLVHECTNAWIPEGVQKGEKGKDVRTGELDASLMEEVKATEATEGMREDSGRAEPSQGGEGSVEVLNQEEERLKKENAQKAVIEGKARSRGHSTADMAGEFAKDINAKRLALNHFSVM
jgi:ribonuclease Z